MAVAVPVNPLELTTQFGSNAVDETSTRYAYLQMHVLSNAVEYSKLSSIASMYLSHCNSGEADELAQTEVSCFLQYECGETRAVARERIRVALALLDLPLTA